ncbi:hypothetical protein [Streptacidiphilus jiangxiensis]|uniref:Uncharacterized protein n=1 Tax=Streptacidiphilus jiangxiensis TaxID=235985 RepID=A0A1H8B6V4_STRJI|nr:hypothetical protein [Streptacidiphilus jiangxiensis]SEM77577.1 hypothetical protein SAMN05414137_1572 [Streptacidiphilus jiangxiensis]
MTTTDRATASGAFEPEDDGTPDIDDIALDIGRDDPLSPADQADADRLVALAEELGLEETDLDEAVHDAASHYASDSSNDQGAADLPLGEALHEVAGLRAAEINNGGLDSQIHYLVGQYGTKETEAMIRSVVGSS